MSLALFFKQALKQLIDPYKLLLITSTQGEKIKHYIKRQEIHRERLHKLRNQIFF